MFKDIGAGFLLLIAGLVGLTIFGAWSLLFGRPAGKYAEETRRQIYEESRSYNQGMALDLSNLCSQYAQADEAAKPAIADTINLRAASYQGTLPGHVERCLSETGR